MAGQAVGGLLHPTTDLQSTWGALLWNWSCRMQVQLSLCKCVVILSFSKKQDESLEAPSQTPTPLLRIRAGIEAGRQENSEQCWCAFKFRKQHSLRVSPSPSFFATLCNAESRSQGPSMVSALWTDQISRICGLSFWFTLWLYGVWRPCYNQWNHVGYTT